MMFEAFTPQVGPEVQTQRFSASPLEQE
jgi:hypothetical protein